jgi:hypothetical protein
MAVIQSSSIGEYPELLTHGLPGCQLVQYLKTAVESSSGNTEILFFLNLSANYQKILKNSLT